MRRYILPTLAAVTLISAVVIATDTETSEKIMPPRPFPNPTYQQPRTISVTGECLRTNIVPDRGMITATATYRDPKTVQGASKYVMEQYEKLNASVKEMGLKDLTVQTSDYSVNPVYEWEQPDDDKPGKQVLKGYEAHLGLNVKTSSIDRLGDVIAKAGELGIANVGGFQLMLADETEHKLRTDCLAEAVANARSKADKMVTAAGSKLGAVITISEDEDYTPPVPMAPRMEMKTMAGAAYDAAAPTIEGGSSSMQINISAIFGIE